MPQKAQNWPLFLLKIYRNLLSSICRKIGKMNLSIIIDKLSVIGNSTDMSRENDACAVWADMLLCFLCCCVVAKGRQNSNALSVFTLLP